MGGDVTANGWIQWSKHVLITIEQLVCGREKDKVEVAVLRAEIGTMQMEINDLKNDLKWKTGLRGTVIAILPTLAAIAFVVFTTLLK